MTDTPQKLLFDIVNNGERIAEFLNGTSSFQSFSNDIKTRYAVERCIEIIGEASFKLTKKLSIRLSLSDRAYNFRGSLVHQYDVIKGETIYNFALMDVPLLVEEARTLLEKN